MLRVMVLGDFGLERDGAAIAPPAGGRARRLLAWLAVNPGLHPRSEVAARFWPDVLDVSARASLRGALSELRRSLGPDAPHWLVSRSGCVGLGVDECVWVDARAVSELEAAHRFAEAVELCRRGRLLAGFDGEWVHDARERHNARIDRMLERLAAAAAEAGERARAVELSRERAALDPLSEDAARSLVAHLAQAGDRAGALAAYERLRGRLRVELGVPPSAPTRALAESIRAASESTDETEAAPTVTPAILSRRFRSVFAARDAEVAQLLRAWNGAVAGGRTLALVAGEPGVGKTRLAVELARRVAADGAHVLYGRCHEEALVPYRPFVEAFAPAARTEASGDALHPLSGELGEPRPGTNADGTRYRFFQAVDDLIGRLAAARPSLLVLDDLHWADKPSLLLLAHVARSPQRARVLIVGTYRETELGHAPLEATLADLRRDPGYERVQLRGLDEAGTARLMAGWMPIGSIAPLAAAVQTQTEGNPFFIEEVLAHLHETGKPIEDLGVAPTIREAVVRRLDRLAAPTAQVLSLAAAIGRVFSLDVLAQLADRPTGQLDRALEEGLAAGLLSEEPGRADRCAFSHALVRETLYAELSGSRRARLHARIADAIEQLDADTPGARLEEIAYHLYEAAPAVGAKRTVEYGARAAARAMTQLAYEDAAAQCVRALDVLDASRMQEPAWRCELLLTLGDARLRVGERDAARKAFAAAAGLARERADADALARAALGFAGLGVTLVGLDAPAVALLDEALRTPGSNDPTLRARLLARQAVELYYTPSRDRSEQLSRDAVASARTTGDPSALGYALNARHVALWRPDRLDERLRIADEMITLEDRAPEIAMQGAHWRVVDLFEAGDFAHWRNALHDHARRAQQLRLPSYGWYTPAWDCTLAAIEGRFDDAWQLREEALAEGLRVGDANAELFAEIHRQLVLMLQRRFAELDLSFLEHKAATSPAAPAYRTALAWLYAQLGRLDDAQPHWEWVAADRFANIPFDLNWMSAMAEIAEAATLLEDRDNAAVAYDLLAPYADRNVAAGRAMFTYGSAHHHLGLLAFTAGRARQAIEHLAEALAAHERLGSPPLIANTRWRQSQALAAQGDHAGAATAAADARTAAARLAISLPPS